MRQCSVCGSPNIYRQGRCQYDYRYWLEHGNEDRVRTPAEQIALNRRRLEHEQRRSLIRGIMSTRGRVVQL